ncbi:MAG TPA: hypothetical protein VGR81_07915 [Candidatus Acidoferrales bacterium]|nr:hypothetical protein [Candidatus Acidoferrales bacterium]
MFCPVCKYEFRRGFAHCNQCDVDLVDSLPPEEDADHSLASPAQRQLDHPVLLWKGASGGVYSALTLALESAHIPYNKEELDARLVFTSEHVDLEIWVPIANLPQAESIRDSVLANPLNADAASSPTLDVAGEDDASAEIPDESNEGPDNIRRENTARELFPEDASAEIWSGADETLADVLKSCLAEIGIACYVARPDEESASGPESASASVSPSASADGHGTFAIRVLPADESRARQIVREVIDATPPQ